MYAPARGQPTPPLPAVILHILMIGGHHIINGKPVETSPAMLLILLEITDIDITIGVDLIAEARLLVIGELPFVNPAILINGNALS